MTDNNTPTFAGSATPGDVVAIMALSDGASTPVQVGQTTAATNGSWSTATNVLTDGGYTFYVQELQPPESLLHGPDSRDGTRGHRDLRAAGVEYHLQRQAGGVRRHLHRRVGLNLGTLINTADYTLSQKKKVLSPTAFGIVGGNGTTTETVAVAFKGAKKLKTGQQILTINAGLVKNAAGEILEGTFRGALPSGNGSPGGNFQAVFNVNSSHKAKGPLPVAVTVAGVKPKNETARVFAAGVSARPAAKGVYSDIFVPVHVKKKHTH